MSTDGVRLSVDVYSPPAVGKYPVLVTRTPYDNNRLSSFSDVATAPAPADRFKKLAAHGFIVVAGDVRGRGDSDGEFVPFVNEGRDGHELIRWARALPEAAGPVGLFGSGYAGYTALAAGSAVDALAISSPFAPQTIPFAGGMLALSWLFWMHLVGGHTPQPVDPPCWNEIFRHRPLISMNERLGRDDVPWATWLSDGMASRGADPPVSLQAVDAPVLLSTGWWDAALDSVGREWESSERDDAPGRSLVIGPWDAESVRHPRPNVGGIDWGPTALIDPDEVLIDWFADHLTGRGQASRSIHAFVTGRNRWNSFERLQGDGGRRVLWLTAKRGANTRRGDGRLVSTQPNDDPPDRFIHNPNQPVPWQPDGRSFSRSAEPLTLDSWFATGRDDVLVYETDPQGTASLIVGRIRAKLYVQTTASDADWLAIIEDVFPGRSRSVHLAHGGVRMGSLTGSVVAGATELTITLPPIAHELLPGHALRLAVASSLFPVYAVNLGGDDYLHGTRAHIAEHTLFHDHERPSQLEVPVAQAEPDLSAVFR